MEIKQYRDRIDRIDEKIMQLLERRAGLAKEIAQEKIRAKLPPVDIRREEAIIRRVDFKKFKNLPPENLSEIYREIISACRNLARPVRVAYLGPKATFTHLAARKRFGKGTRYFPVSNIPEVFHRVEKGLVEAGVVPIESSTEGSVVRTIDMFLESPAKICGEIYLRVEHNLLSREKSLRKIKIVYSHPQALAQCRGWVEENLPRVVMKETVSTAEAAKIASRRAGSAAIGSSLAGEIYALDVLAQYIEDSPQNYTRFLIISSSSPGPTGKDKTSLLFSVRDKIGALYYSLKPFKDAQINLTKIESRPSRRRAWEYVFFVEMAGHLQESSVERTVARLEKECLWVKVLGSYPRAKRVK